MKSYHPSGHIVKSNGQLSGFILRSGAHHSEPPMVVDLTIFERMVAKNMVQLFQMGPSGPEINLTEEEFKKFKKNINYYTSTSVYLASNACFYEGDIARTMINPRYIAISLVYCKEVLHSPMVGMVMYRSDPFVPSELSYMKSWKVNTSIEKHSADRILAAAGMWSNLSRYLENEFTGGFGINPNTMLDTSNQMHNKKVLLTKPIDMQIIRSIASESVRMSANQEIFMKQHGLLV